MGRKSSLLVALVASFALAVLISGCSSGSSSSVTAVVAPSSRQAPAVPVGAAPSPAPFVSSQPARAATVTLPLIVCPTTIALASPPAPKPQPSVVSVSASGPAVAELAVYTDNQGRMRVLGPKGWACSAQYGADGSGGVVVYPAGESVPSNWGAGWRLPAGSSVQAIIGSETSACMGCGEAQACELFGIAAKSFKTDFGRPCPGVRPTAGSTAQVSAGIMAFADPPGVVGDGNPSGGQYPANGVMTYYSGNQDGSWQETCTLAGASKPLCTTTLNSFLAAYGNRLFIIAGLLVSPARRLDP